jgi:hypothetical protein
MRVPPGFDWNEGRILDAMYEVANGTYDSYTLAQNINPSIQSGTPEALKAFIESRGATEQLIVRGFVRGERDSGADGVYFKKLSLTPKGERAAIQHRKESQDLKSALPDIGATAAEIIKEMNKEK